MATATKSWTDALEEKETQQDEYQEEHYSPEAEARLKTFAQDFHHDLKALAKQYMEQFFKDKSLHCGGKIPRSLLYTEQNLSMVMNYDISKGVDHAYGALEPLLSPEEIRISRQTGEATRDIKLVNETLNLLARSGVPQQFAGGMLILFLRFVEGVDFSQQRRLVQVEGYVEEEDAA